MPGGARAAPGAIRQDGVDDAAARTPPAEPVPGRWTEGAGPGRHEPSAHPPGEDAAQTEAEAEAEAVAGAEGEAEAAADPIARVNAWRAGAERSGGGVVTAAIAAALARRAAGLKGGARHLVLQRLDTLLARHAGAPPAPAAWTHAPSEPARAPQVALADLTALVDRLGRAPVEVTAPPASGEPEEGRGRAKGTTRSRPATRGAPDPGSTHGRGPASRRVPSGSASSASLRQAAGGPGLLNAPPPRPLKAVAAFHRTWSRLRAEQRLRQALDQVPAKAGPLNSAHVVSRALQALHALSPAYLDAFMAHVDTLLWLEQHSGAGDLAPRAAASAEPPPRPAKKAKRKRS